MSLILEALKKLEREKRSSEQSQVLCLRSPSHWLRIARARSQRAAQ